MPPPASNPDQQNPLIQSQLRELAAALTQMAQMAHAQNSHYRRAGEVAERFGRTLDDARQNLHREFRDLVVAVHFVNESLGRAARHMQAVQSRALSDAARAQSQQKTDSFRATQQAHYAKQQEHWAKQHASWAQRSTSNARSASPPAKSGPFVPSPADIARGMQFARGRDQAAGRTPSVTSTPGPAHGLFRLNADGTVTPSPPRRANPMMDVSRAGVRPPRAGGPAPGAPPDGMNQVGRGILLDQLLARNRKLAEHRGATHLGLEDLRFRRRDPDGLGSDSLKNIARHQAERRERSWDRARSDGPGAPFDLSGSRHIVPGRPILAQRAAVPPMAARSNVPIAPMASGGAGMMAMSAAGPAVGAFAAVMMVCTTVAKTWADVLSATVQAASPNVWKTLTGSVELLMAQIGTTMVPMFVRLAMAAQSAAEALEKMDRARKDKFIMFGIGLVSPSIPILDGILRQMDSRPDQMRMSTRTQEPRFSSVESVWEQMALGFLREDEFERKLMEINQQMLAEMMKQTALAERERKPGA